MGRDLVPYWDAKRPFFCTKTQAEKMAPMHVPYLISWPRAGSHWLRIMLEQITDRPCLVRSFYMHPNPNWLLLHRHMYNDDHPAPRKRERLVLLRKLSDTLFSLAEYLDKGGAEWVGARAREYRKWYKRWVPGAEIVITYESLLVAPSIVLSKVLPFLGAGWEEQQLQDVADRTTPALVRALTQGYNPRIVPTRRGRPEARAAFKKEWGSYLDAVDEELRSDCT